MEMERVQFPIRLCFGITANKSQGQTYKRVGINLSNAEMFSHGQLYVALSRVGSAKAVSIFKPKGKCHFYIYFFEKNVISKCCGIQNANSDVLKCDIFARYFICFLNCINRVFSFRVMEIFQNFIFA